MAPNSNLLGSLQLPFFRPMGLDFYTVKHNRWFLLITGLVKVLVQHGRRKNVTDNMIDHLGEKEKYVCACMCICVCVKVVLILKYKYISQNRQFEGILFEQKTIQSLIMNFCGNSSSYVNR